MTDVSSGKVPILECVVIAWRFLIENWRRFLPAAVVVAVASAVAPLLLGLLLGGPTAGAILAGQLVEAIALVFFTAAVLRYAIRGEFNGATGLAFGPDEARLVGVLAAVSAIAAPLIFLVLMVWSASIIGSLGLTAEELETRMADQAAFNQTMTEAMGRPPNSSVIVIAILAIGLGFYLFSRLAMANAASIGERKFVLFQSWSWSKGNVLRIMAAVIVTALPATLINLIINSMLSGISVAEDNPGGILIYVVMEALRVLIATLIGIPYIALGAHLYKGLRPSGFTAR